jgi:hypothetical protein
VVEGVVLRDINRVCPGRYPLAVVASALRSSNSAQRDSKLLSISFIIEETSPTHPHKYPYHLLLPFFSSTLAAFTGTLGDITDLVGLCTGNLGVTALGIAGLAFTSFVGTAGRLREGEDT